MRFEVSHVLDAIERRLTTEPGLARAVLDVAEVVRYVDLDGGRPATLLRLGMVIDSLARHLSEENVLVYCIVDKGMLSDLDQPSSERMVVRRWADDGHVEVVPGAQSRVMEVAELAGLPVISRMLPGLAVVSTPGGVTLTQRGPTPNAPSELGRRLMSRRWRCQDPECGLFGQMRLAIGQPLPRLRGVPLCPRHEVPLADVGPAPVQEVMSVRINGVIKQRFLVTSAAPVVVGRAPENGIGIILGPWLDEKAVSAVSRAHLVLSIDQRGLLMQDISMNGAWIHPGNIKVTPKEHRVIAPGEYVELYPGVEIGRPSSFAPGGPVSGSSVMAEAPTMSFRMPPR